MKNHEKYENYFHFFKWNYLFSNRIVYEYKTNTMIINIFKITDIKKLENENSLSICKYAPDINIKYDFAIKLSR